jgi:hypothetical protein
MSRVRFADQPTPETAVTTNTNLSQRANSASQDDRSLGQRLAAGGVFTLLYGAGIGTSIWAGITMLAVETEERRAQFGEAAYPEAASVYGPMLLVLACGLPFVWAWWTWRPARASGLTLGRVMRLAAVALLISSSLAPLAALVVDASAFLQSWFLALVIGLILWPLTGLLVAVALWISDKVWGSTRP